MMADKIAAGERDEYTLKRSNGDHRDRDRDRSADRKLPGSSSSRRHSGSPARDRERERDRERDRERSDRDRHSSGSGSKSSSSKAEGSSASAATGSSSSSSSRDKKTSSSSSSGSAAPSSSSSSSSSSSKDRERERERDGKDKSSSSSSSRKRSRSPARRDTRHRSRSRSRERYRRHRSPDPEEVKRREAEAARKASLEEHTIFVTGLHPKIDEADLFDFFSHVGRVEDIRLIRDNKTNKSKGLCYVEFWEKESVVKAMALTGQLLGGYPITVMTVATPEKQSKPVAAIQAEARQRDPGVRLYVGSLHFNVTESDLRTVFEAFGPVERVELHKDPATKQSRGFGFVTFRLEADGRQALATLNGVPIAGRPMKLGMVDPKDGSYGGSGGGGSGSGGSSGGGYAAAGIDNAPVGKLDELDDGERGGLALTASSRAQLMHKLQRGDAAGLPNPLSYLPTASAAASAAAPAPVAAPAVPLGPTQPPSTCVIVKNMFDPTAPDNDPEYALDVRDDVEEECLKHTAGTGGAADLKHLFVDKQTPGGHVYVRFGTREAAEKVVRAFTGRWYAQRQVVADFVAEAAYTQQFPESAK